MEWFCYIIIIGAVFLGIYNLMAIGVKRRGYKSTGQVKRDSWQEIKEKYPVKIKTSEVNKKGWKKSKAKYF